MTASFKNSLEKLKTKALAEVQKPNPEDPKDILNQLVKDLNEAYPGQLDGQIGFGDDRISGKRTGYNFYLIAAIGGGYVYHLFSLEPIDLASDFLGYPLKLKIGSAGESKGIAHNGSELSTLINGALESAFVQNIILNLVEQAGQFKESRKS
jgi:hypothetical protein